MYDELVKRLRNEAKSPDNYPEDSILMQEAADAIEELNKRIDRAVRLYNRNVEKTAMYEALVGLNPEPLKEEI